MDYTIQKEKTIILRSASKVRQIFVENIIYITCDSYLISIALKNQKSPEIFSSSLKYLQSELDAFHFFRINRNQIVNLKYFKYCHFDGSRKIKLTNGEDLVVSRRNWTAIKRWLNLVT